MFSKNDPAADPSNKGGWPQPRQWSKKTVSWVSALIVVGVVVMIIGINIFVGKNSDKVPPGGGNGVESVD